MAYNLPPRSIGWVSPCLLITWFKPIRKYPIIGSAVNQHDSHFQKLVVGGLCSFLYRRRWWQFPPGLPHRFLKFRLEPLIFLIVRFDLNYCINSYKFIKIIVPIRTTLIRRVQSASQNFVMVLWRNFGSMLPHHFNLIGPFFLSDRSPRNIYH